MARRTLFRGTLAMTNAGLLKKIEGIVDNVCDAKGYNKTAGPKGERSTGNVLVGLAIDKYLPQILAECGVEPEIPGKPATIPIGTTPTAAEPGVAKSKRETPAIRVDGE